MTTVKNWIGTKVTFERNSRKPGKMGFLEVVTLSATDQVSLENGWGRPDGG
jgi:hypothetical protein